MKYFGADSAYRNTLYGGNQYPSKSNGEPKTFDELCGDTTGSLRRLGVLRMDVDNLGKLFINGFTQGNSSLSRYSSLSRNLDFFFKGYLNKIWEGDQRLNEKTSIIYAGGDDLFIVGHWNETIRFAKLIREEFKKWTCNNPNLSISGGVAIVSKKFPIAKGALLAGDAEDMAKDHTYQTHSKNTFTFMDIPLHWEYELPYVEKLKDELISKIGTQKEISKGFINKIATLHFLSTEQEKKGANQSWKWMMAYDFARAIKELKNDDVKDFLQTLKVDTFANTIDGKKNLSKHSTLSLYNLAARWAELIIRE
ncbi:MAG: hypothetical protein IPO63_17610 [Bacteroidetes bacterium]|nr:hypothetical protein [Bacteroidota bacterium]